MIKNKIGVELDGTHSIGDGDWHGGALPHRATSHKNECVICAPRNAQLRTFVRLAVVCNDLLVSWGSQVGEARRNIIGWGSYDDSEVEFSKQGIPF